MSCERQLGEPFEDFKRRRLIENKAERFWLKGRTVHISRVPVESMIGPNGKRSTIYASNTYRREGSR
jgi:hypothetical protein